MKTFPIKFVFIFSLLFTHSVFTEARWRVVQTVSTRLIWNIAFADNTTVYAVGDSLLMKSNDGGDTWIDLLPNIAPVTSDKKFWNLRFINKDTGFVFRNTLSENLFLTTDGGATWSDVSSGIIPSGLLDVEFVNDSVGYAVGGFYSDSLIARTTDGGHSWTHIPKPPLCDAPMAVHFLTEHLGFTGDNEIYKTTDAGVTWTLTSTPGGWPQSNSYGDRVTNYKFMDHQTGYAIRDDWHIYKTTDGGNNWTLSQLPVSGIGGGCRDIDFNQNIYGYVVGYGMFQPFISSDAGSSWLIDGTYPAYYPATCLSVSKNHKIIIGTREGEVVLNENSPVSSGTIGNHFETSLYPNPGTGIFYVTANSKIESIEVYNLIGAAVFHASPPMHNNSYELNLTSLPKGIYVIKLSGAGGSVQRKLVLE